MDPKDLECPLTLEILDCPITVPCCGRSMSRAPLVLHCARSRGCPCCRAELPADFDPSTAPRNVVLSYVIESLRGGDSGRSSPNPPPPQWKTQFCGWTPPAGGRRQFGELTIRSEPTDDKGRPHSDRAAVKPSLFVALIDRSGSMDSPWRQVTAALKHMIALTLGNPQIRMRVIAYSSSADLVPLPVSNHSAELQEFIRRLNFGGGTNFFAAFDRLAEVFRSERPKDYASVTVAFLTDGMADGGRDQLVQRFGEVVALWDGPLKVHCIGFGRECDKKFLEQLRSLRPENEGTFRYAESSDDDDALCHKLTTLFDLALRTSGIQLKLKFSSSEADGWLFFNPSTGSSSESTEVLLPLDLDGRGKVGVWVSRQCGPLLPLSSSAAAASSSSSAASSATSSTSSSPSSSAASSSESLSSSSTASSAEPSVFPELQIELPDGRQLSVAIEEIHTSAEMAATKKRWLASLIDRLAGELMELSGEGNASGEPLKLRVALVLQKIRVIQNHLASDDSASRERLAWLQEQTLALGRGQSLNAGRLADARFGSQFATQSKVKVTHSPSALPAPTAVPVAALTSTCQWTEHHIRYSHNHEGRQRNALQCAILDEDRNRLTPAMRELIAASQWHELTQPDAEGNDALHLAAYCGHSEIINELLHRLMALQSDSTALRALLKVTNADQETPMTLAIKKRGYTKTMENLSRFGGAIPPSRRASLEQFALAGKYKRTLNLMASLSDEKEITFHDHDGASSSSSSSSVISRQPQRLDIQQNMTLDYLEYQYQRVKSSAPGSFEVDWEVFLKTVLSKPPKPEMLTLVERLLTEEPAIRHHVSLVLLLDHAIPPKPDDPQTPAYLSLARMLMDSQPNLAAGRLPPSPEQLEILSRHSTPEEVEQAREWGETAVFRATERGSLPHVMMFLDRHPELLDVPNELGNTPLWLACAKRYPCIAEELLRRGADANRPNLKGNPPMYSICGKMGHLKMCDLLLAHGAQVDWINKNGDTLLLLCCRNNQPEVLERLLFQTSGPDDPLVRWRAQIDGFDVTFASVEADHPECLRTLERFGVRVSDPHLTTAVDNPILAGGTPLHLAAFYGRMACARELVNLGARLDIPSTDANRQTPLHLAVIQGHVELASFLVNAGADVNVTDAHGQSPLSFASAACAEQLKPPALDVMMRLARQPLEEGSPSLEALKRALEIRHALPGILPTPASLIDHLRDAKGNNPLIEAVIHGNHPLIRLLLEHGADPINHHNSFGLNALSWTTIIQQPFITSLFRRHLSETNQSLEDLKQRITAVRGRNSTDAKLLYFARGSAFCESDDSPVRPVTSSMTVRWTFAQRGLVTQAEMAGDGDDDDALHRHNKVHHCAPTLPKEVLRLMNSDSDNSSSDERAHNKAPNSTATPPPERARHADHCRWMAKVFMANRVAADELILSPREVFALSLYACNDELGPLVDQLIRSRHLLDAAGGLPDGVNTLLQALQKLPNHTGEVYLVANLDQIRRFFSPEAQLKSTSLLSSTTVWAHAHQVMMAAEKAGEPAPTLLMIQSLSGRHIGRYSPFSSDHEVIFLPETRFVVKRWYRYSPIALGQPNIRIHTFSLKQQNEIFEMSLPDCRKPLIIELIEIPSTAASS